MTYRVDGVLINFANSTGSQEEAAAYLSHALKPPTPDPDTGLTGCWHCRNIEAHRIEYVIAVRTKGGTPMNMPVDCPYHYCPACGRKLEVDDD